MQRISNKELQNQAKSREQQRIAKSNEDYINKAIAEGRTYRTKSGKLMIISEFDVAVGKIINKVIK